MMMMDLSVLPNNNHPEKFLQLDVKNLATSPSFMQAGFAAGAALSGQRHWQNRVYLQRERKNTDEDHGNRSPESSPVLLDKFLGKHITPITLNSKIKRNPLYSDTRTADEWDTRKTKPSWTIQEFDRHSVHSNLVSYLKEDPNELRFWMEDPYTPGYDSLLKKKEMEARRAQICKCVAVASGLVLILIVIITVSVVVTLYRH
ncbi:major intrinsically disordered NOTCH2-binding receptor 1-like [Erpetoichthys calabaricus]|nr:major intrinsically disordered NOTCH2-binding receptor 1-like [Erpetoichthys calabaricus]